MTPLEIAIAVEKVNPKAAKFEPWLSSAMMTCDINTPLRIAHFLAQLTHESGNFVYTREIWGPTPAQKRYEGRKDLGNVVKGDGSKFRGRGLIQTTGRANYQKVSQRMFGDDRLLDTPEMLERASNACLSAALFWTDNGLNKLADLDDVVKVTKKVNGGTNGLEDRKKWLSKYKGVLGL